MHSVLHLGQTLEHLDRAALKAATRRFEQGGVGGLADTLIRYANAAYKAARAHARAEIAWGYNRRKRSYALDPEEWPGYGWELADYYRDYLSELAGVAERDLLERAQQTLEEGEREDPSPSAANLSDRLGQLFPSFRDSRLATIVRTEGTRVTSAARRDVGLEALLSRKYAPDYFIYSSILDGRTTHTCTFAHGHRRPLDMGSPLWDTIPPPNHYNCRAIETYGYEWDDQDRAAKEWTPAEVARFESIRREEFPYWEPRLLPSRPAH